MWVGCWGGRHFLRWVGEGCTGVGGGGMEIGGGTDNVSGSKWGGKHEDLKAGGGEES